MRLIDRPINLVNHHRDLRYRAYHQRATVERTQEDKQANHFLFAHGRLTIGERVDQGIDDANEAEIFNTLIR